MASADSDYKRAWAKANPDKIRAAKARYYEKNKEKVKAKNREWQRAWREANPETAKERERNRKKDRSYEKTPEFRAKRATYVRKRIAENPALRERHLELRRRWGVRNPDKIMRSMARAILAKSVGVDTRDVPLDLAEAKAAQLKAWRAARAIETRQGGDVKQAPSQHDESAVPKGDAPK